MLWIDSPTTVDGYVRMVIISEHYDADIEYEESVVVSGSNAMNVPHHPVNRHEVK